MPIYEYECDCGECAEYYLPIDKCDEDMPCQCGDVMNKIISPVSNAYCSGYPYYDTTLEREITDPAHRKNVLRESGLQERG